MSQDRLELFWAITENLGDWTVVRKRLNDEFQRKQGTPLASTGLAVQTQPLAGIRIRLISRTGGMRCAMPSAWAGRPSRPPIIVTTGGKHSWTIGTSPDSVPLARHTALDR